MVATLIGSFVCTIATAVICDNYDYDIYMTKAYICIGTTFMSILCCGFMYLVQSYFWVSMMGLFIENLLSTGWGQPAIGILSAVVDPEIRGTAVGVFFFLISVFGIIAPYGFVAIQNHYGLDPFEEPVEFGWLCALTTGIPCVLAIPAFYMAGVRYSWHRFNEAILMIDRFGSEAAAEWDEITKKRKYQRIGDPEERSNLSASVDWKLLREQRKMKRKQAKYIMEVLQKDIAERFRAHNSKQHSFGDANSAGGNDVEKAQPMLRSGTQYIGVLPEIKKTMVKEEHHSELDENDIDYQLAADGRKMANSMKVTTESDLLQHHKQEFFRRHYGAFFDQQYQ